MLLTSNSIKAIAVLRPFANQLNIGSQFKNKALEVRNLKLIFLLVACFSPFKSFSQYAFEWTGMSPRFNNGVSNLVAYIDFGEAVLWGNVEVSLTYAYNSQNTTGLYRKSYNIGRNNIATIKSNTSEVTSALGPVADQWKLDDFEVNSSNHLVIPIYHHLPVK